MHLLERQSELEELHSRLHAARAGTGQMVFVCGEAGVGKSTLLEAFADEVGEVAWGWCDALQTPHALGPVQEIAARLLPVSDNRDESPARLFPALLQALQRAGDARVLILEDLHWADEATLDFVAWLGRRIRHVPVFLLASFRDDELPPTHHLRRVLGHLAGTPATRLPLRGLSQEAVVALAAESGLDGARLYRVSGGNPFFVSELLAAPPGEVPPTVSDAVLARLARCSGAARTVVEAASLSPGRIEYWLLEGALDASAAGIDEAVGQGLLRRDGDAFAFRHELARLAVESSLPAARARDLHARLLNALGGRDASLSRRVHHAERAGDAAATLECARRAADEAARRESHREAAAHYATALRHAEALPAAERASLHEAHAHEAHLGNQVAAASAAAEAALHLWRELNDVMGQARMLLQLSRQNWKSGRRADAERCTADAIALLEPSPPCHELAMAWSTRSQLAMLAGDVADAVACGERAAAMAAALNDAEVQAHALNNIGASRLSIGDESGYPPLERSLQLALAHGLHEDAGRAYANLGACSMALHRLERAEAALLEGIPYADEHGLHDKALYMRAWLARLELECGRWSEAAEVATALLEEVEPDSYQRIPALVVLSLVRARRGDPGADEALNEALHIALPTGELQRIGRVAAARAECAWYRGDAAGIAAETATGLNAAQDHFDPWIVGELQFLHSLAEPVEARDGIAEPYRRMIAGDWRGAAGEWWERGMPYERAMALAQGPEPAQREALELAQTLGAAPLATILRQRLREAGARKVPRGPRADTRNNPAGLTRREIEVLGLLGRDAALSNAELGRRLHLSTRTVEHHVSAILSKLQVGSRVEAAQAARRLGFIVEPLLDSPTD